MALREIITDWNVDGNGGGSSIMYFSTVETPAEQRADLAALWAALAPRLANTTRWTIRTEGREIDPATGGLTAAWVEGTSRTGLGSGGATPVPNAAQMLLRWKTNVIAGGRFVRGRTYVPGMDQSNVSGGGINSSTITAVNTALTNFIGSVGFAIWHRPKSGQPGSQAGVTDGSLWNEMAVQRKRRS